MIKYVIMTILIHHRKKNAEEVQHLLTKFGCNIKMRLGLHETVNICADDGLVILQLDGEDQEIFALEKALNDIDGVQSKLTIFE